MKIIVLLFYIIIMFACQKSQQVIPSFDNVKDEKLITALKIAYNFSSFDEDPSPQEKIMITEAITTSHKYKNIFSKININSLKIYENIDENITVAIFNFENTSEKLFSLKGYFLNNKFIITNDFLFERKLENKENGQMIITNNNDAIIIKIDNGIQS